MSIQVPPLVYRLVKGSALTSAEHDANLRTLRDYANSLGQLVLVSLNPDGTFIDQSINRQAMFSDRIVPIDALHWHANFYGVATKSDESGAATVYDVTVDPNPTSGADPCEAATLSFDPGDGTDTSFRIALKFDDGNDVKGPCQLVIKDSGGNILKAATDLLKFGSDALELNEVETGMILLVQYDGTNWQVISPVKVVENENESTSATAPALGSSVTLAHTKGRIPDILKVWMQLQTGKTEYGYDENDYVDISCFLTYIADGATQWQIPAFQIRQTTTSVTVVRTNKGSGTATATPVISRKDTGAWDGTITNYNNWDLHIEAIWLPT